MERRRFQVQAAVVVAIVVAVVAVAVAVATIDDDRQGAYLIGSTGLWTETFNWITAF